MSALHDAEVRATIARLNAEAETNKSERRELFESIYKLQRQVALLYRTSVFVPPAKSRTK